MQLATHAAAEITCPYCGSASAMLIRRKIGDAETAPFFETRHSLYRCGECDLYFAAPVTPELLAGMRRYFEHYNVIRYGDLGVGRRMVVDTWSRPWWRKRLTRMVGQLRQFKWRATGFKPDWGNERIEQTMTLLFEARARSVLDVGAAHGGLVRAARDAGFDAYGIEPTRGTVDLIRASGGGSRVSYGFFPDQRGPLDRYDALTFVHVLTHFAALTPDFFSACRNALNDGGALLIFCSNPEMFGKERQLESALLSPITLSHTTERFMRRVARDLRFSNYRFLRTSKSAIEPYNCFHILTR